MLRRCVCVYTLIKQLRVLARHVLCAVVEAGGHPYHLELDAHGRGLRMIADTLGDVQVRTCQVKWQPGQAENLARRGFLYCVVNTPGHSGKPLIVLQDLPQKCEGWCQPNIRVRPCHHRQHSLMRTARVRCAVQKQYHNKSYSFGTD